MSSIGATDENPSYRDYGVIGADHLIQHEPMHGDLVPGE